MTTFTVDAPPLLSHVVVGVTAFVSDSYTPRYLPMTLECIAKWRKVVGMLELTVFTNAEHTVRLVVEQHFRPLQPGWHVKVSAWAHGISATARSRGYLLTHAHLHTWSAMVASPKYSKATAFVHLEDDLCPNADAMRAWARDVSLLEASGAASSGFQRGFYRY